MADFDFSALLADPNFQSLLAGTGARLDPEGAGGAIGQSALQMIQGKAAQKATGDAEAKRQKFNEQILALLGGLTPKEMPGPTSVKMGPGQMTVDMTPPGGGAETPGGPLGPATTSGGGVATPGQTPKLSDILPFF